MRRFPRQFVSAAIACLLILPITAEAASQKQSRTKPKSDESVYIPKDLEECFAELDKMLSPKDREEFRKKSEDDLFDLHFGLGMWMRNNWRLWAGSRLQKYFAAMGVPHPESISSIIITSYWRRENHQEIRLEEQIAKDKAAWEKQRKEQQEEEVRAAQAFEKIRQLVLGFEYVEDSSPKLVMPKRSNDELRARFLAPFRDGVLLTVREIVASEGPKDTYRLIPYFLNLKTQRIHPVHFPEMPHVLSSVVVGDRLWVIGDIGGQLRLEGFSPVDCTPIPLPRSDEAPQLGLSGDQLLLVYSTAIFRREGNEWKQLYSGDLKLPFSGPPPRQFADRICFRDEGRWEDDKQLWYFELSPTPRLVTVWEDTGLVGPSGPRWENTFGYCALKDGTLWVSFGGGSRPKSLVRREPNGEYRIAVINNAVKVQGDLLGGSNDNGPRFVATSGSGWKDMGGATLDKESAGPSISGITARSADDLIAVGDGGLFEIRGGQIRRLVAFRNTHQNIRTKDGVFHWNWDPTDILVLADNSYLISGTFGGIYLLWQDDSKRWHFKSLDERLGEPLIW